MIKFEDQGRKFHFLMDIKQAFCASAKKCCRMEDSQDYNDNHLIYTIDQIGRES